MLRSARLTLVGLALTAPAAWAGPLTNFDSFTPLATSVPGGSRPEATPFALSSPFFRQRTVSANNTTPRNGDNWDMITSNESGPQAGRFLFSPYETGTAGVRRVDLQLGTTTTIVAPGTAGFVSGDASRWTPFGTYITAEESWASPAAGGTANKGRLFELTNPLGAPGAVGFTNQNVVPRTSKEGFAFDRNNNMYFVDELNGGGIFKYTSLTPNNSATFFSAGQTSALKVGAGGQSEGGGAAITGATTWSAFTDTAGLAPALTVNVSDAGVNGTTPGTAVDGRAGRVAAGGTGFNRPEDLEIQTLANGDQILYFAATDSGPGGNGRVYSLNLTTGVLKLFVDVNTINAATGLPVGGVFRNPDNLAIDSEGNIYIVEDQQADNISQVGGDIWFAQDIDRDGVAESIGRWASLSTLGAEPTGLYFSPFNPDVAYINVQHANSDVDRTIEFAVPAPASLSLLAAGLMAGGIARRKKRM